MPPLTKTLLKIAALVACGVVAWLLKQSLATYSKSAFDSGKWIEDNGVVYLNTAPDVRFVGKEVCAECHAEIYESYSHAEMGRSMARLTDENIIEDFRQKQAVYDSSLGYYYEMLKKDGRFFQREFRLGPDGKVVHERVVEAQYALGSGNNLRMYFRNENGMLYEMPLTWYTNEKRWKLSPGYEDFANLRFSRFATQKCIACHNSYLQKSATAPDRYEEPFALGIGCERCHGPGELHVKEQRGEPVAVPPGQVRTIVNPIKLSFEKQMDVCRQCHLQGKAWALRPGKGWFDFRAGMSLASHRSVFFPKKTHKEVFEVADSAQRLALSACFLKSAGKMTCITCHNPHRSIKTFDQAYYNDKCVSCHASADLARIDKPGSTVHSPAADCVTCHMNRTGTDNTLHGVSNTDHWIRVDANKTTIDWALLKVADKDKPVVTLTAEVDAPDNATELRRGIAYLDYYRERDNRRFYLDSARVYLMRAQAKLPHMMEVFATLGAVYYELNVPDQAVAAYQRAIELTPGDGQLHYELGRVYALQGNNREAAASFKRAVQLQPNCPEYLESLGAAQAELDEIADALHSLQQAVEIDQQNPYTYYRLGNLYVFQLNQPAEALPFFEKAVELDPDLPNGLINLGNCYAATGGYPKAIEVYKRELMFRPKSAFAAANLGRLYLLQGQPEQARGWFQKALSLDPSLTVAQEGLEALK